MDEVEIFLFKYCILHDLQFSITKFLKVKATTLLKEILAFLKETIAFIIFEIVYLSS